MSLGQRDGHERFALAVDAMLASAESPETSSEHEPVAERADEKMAGDLAVVALLRRAAGSAGPDPATWGRMRQRVLAGANGTGPSLTPPRKTPTGAPATSGARAGGGDIRAIGPTARSRARLAVTCAAAVCVLLSLSGISLLLSRDAVPGDTLYTIKRGAEAASLELTFGQEPKARKHLEFAKARVDEIETLTWKHRDAGGDPARGHLTALTDFDAEATAASRLLTQLPFGDSHRLDTLSHWAQAQSHRLTTVLPVLPDQAAPRVETTLALLARITQRSAELLERDGCAIVTSGATDDIGALPATDPCVPAPASHSSSGTRTGERRMSVPSGQPPGQQTRPTGEPDQPLTGSRSPSEPTATPDVPLRGQNLPSQTPTLAGPSAPLAPPQPPTVLTPQAQPTIELRLDGLPKLRLGS